MIPAEPNYNVIYRVTRSELPSHLPKVYQGMCYSSMDPGQYMTQLTSGTF